MAFEQKRVVVTGIGLITPLGNGVKGNWDSLIAGQSGLDAITRFKVDDLPCRVGGAVPVGDNVLVIDAFCRFLQEKIKVNGKAGVLGDAVTLTVDGTNINVVAQSPFSKRYLKYLTKKYLKKNQLRDYIHVIASNKNTYELKYFNINDGGAAGAESDDE